MTTAAKIQHVKVSNEETNELPLLPVTRVALIYKKVDFTQANSTVTKTVWGFCCVNFILCQKIKFPSNSAEFNSVTQAFSG